MARKKGRLAPIADLLCEATARSGIDRELRRYALWERWGELVGAEIAAHARPARWHGTTLVVRVEHPTWIQELGFLKPNMISKIKERMPALPLKEIRFEVGALPPADVPADEKPVAARELSSKEMDLVHCASSEIPDPEIREAAERAMAKCISSRGR